MVARSLCLETRCKHCIVHPNRLVRQRLISRRTDRHHLTVMSVSVCVCVSIIVSVCLCICVRLRVAIVGEHGILRFRQ